MAGLSDDLKLALGPVPFAQACGIQNPDPWQRRFLTDESRRVIACCARQTGKSSMCAIVSLHKALYYPGSTVILVSPSLRQSQLLFRKVTEYYHALGSPMPAEVENRLSLELENGSTIVSLPGTEKTVRGFSSVSLLVLDEAAAVDPALYAALTPMTLVSQGRLIMASTPRGQVGKFYEVWRQREERGWSWYHVPVTAVERIPIETIEEFRANMTGLEFAQEMMVQFNAPEGAFFNAERVREAFSAEVQPLIIEGIEETGWVA